MSTDLQDNGVKFTFVNLVCLVMNDGIGQLRAAWIPIVFVTAQEFPDLLVSNVMCSGYYLYLRFKFIGEQLDRCESK